MAKASGSDTPDGMSHEQLQRGFKYFVGDGICSQSMTTLTQGAILTGFALKLGASNSVIGVLSAIIALTQLIQIPSIYIVEKYKARRSICVAASAGARTLLLVMGLIPFLFASAELAVVFLIVALLINTSIASISTCSWNSWMHDLIPPDELGSLFSKRIARALAVSIPLYLASGFLIDYSKNLFNSALFGYSILFFGGFGAGMLGLFFLSHIPHTPLQPAGRKEGFLRKIFDPFKDTNFRKVIVFLAAWNFAVNMASPFFTVYLLDVLGFEMSTVVILNVLSLLTNIAFLRLWGRVADRLSNKSVLGICGPLFILVIFLWPFTTMPGVYFLTLPLLVVIYLLIGVSTAGTTLATQNIGLKLASSGEATSYLASSSFVSSLAAGFSPVLGGVLADGLIGTRLAWNWTWTTPSGQVSFEVLNFNNWGFVFIIAVLIGIYSIHRLAMVQESGEVKEKVVAKELVSEMRNGLRNTSFAVGIQRMIEFPYSLMRHQKPSTSSKASKGTKESPTET